MTTDLTDRERLVLALDELVAEHGYIAPNVADLHCCGTCLVGWMDDGDIQRAVGFHVQSDERAFGYGLAVVCARCNELDDQAERIGTNLDACPDCEEDAWRAARHDHILTDHHRLVGTLHLLVRGDLDLVVAVLCRHGLQAELAPWGGCLEVSAGARP